MDIAQHVIMLFSKKLNSNSKMLTPRLTNALYYNSIPVLLQEIDNAIFIIANELYYNTIYSLHRNIDSPTMIDLLNYRRILTYKACNLNYCADFPVDVIASRVIVLIKGMEASPLNINTTTTTTTQAASCTLEGTAVRVF
jgi:hypothetical protein